MRRQTLCARAVRKNNRRILNAVDVNAYYILYFTIIVLSLSVTRVHIITGASPDIGNKLLLGFRSISACKCIIDNTIRHLKLRLFNFQYIYLFQLLFSIVVIHVILSFAYV